jgi:hypothetical protein
VAVRCSEIDGAMKLSTPAFACLNLRLSSFGKDSMKNISTKASLSDPQRRLLQAMQRLNFGRIEGLKIYNGQPVFHPAPRVIQDIKIGGENGPRPELNIDDFALKSAVIEFFDHLERIDNGTLESIEVKYGMPFKLVIEQTV